jgi:hypothetical protein
MKTNYASLIYKGKTVDFRSKQVFRAERRRLVDEHIPHQFIIHALSSEVRNGIIPIV